MGDKLLDFRSAHFSGVAFVVKENILAYPMNISLFGTGRVLFEANVFAILVEEFFPLWGRCRFGSVLHILAPFLRYLYNADMQSIRYYTAKSLLCTPFWVFIQRAV